MLMTVAETVAGIVRAKAKAMAGANDVERGELMQKLLIVY